MDWLCEREMAVYQVGLLASWRHTCSRFAVCNIIAACPAQSTGCMLVCAGVQTVHPHVALHLCIHGHRLLGVTHTCCHCVFVSCRPSSA